MEVGEIRTALTVLSDEVARELRRHNLKGGVVGIQIRRPDRIDTGADRWREQAEGS